MNLFDCPLPSAITSIPTYNCPIIWGQIQKLAFRRIKSAAALTTTSAGVKATFTPLLTATDDTKVIVTPYLLNLVIPNTEALTEGGNDNTTINGVSKLKGLGATKVTAELHNAPSDVAKALKGLTAESSVQPGVSNLEVILLTETNVIGKKVGASGFTGFKLFNFVITDVGSEGYGKDNVYKVQFELAGGWSEDHVSIGATDFSPSSDL